MHNWSVIQWFHDAVSVTEIQQRIRHCKDVYMWWIGRGMGDGHDLF